MTNTESPSTPTASTDEYGPQTDHVRALLTRANTLTEDEQEALDATLDGLWGSEFDRAQETADDLAYLSGRHGAFRAATKAADAVSGVYAKYAAQALVLRDLIGTEYWSQERYDLLTQAWVTHVGPVHPDDPPAR